MGCASVYHLASAGLRVIGLDQFGPTNGRRASSHYRGVRQAYFDDERHVELAIESTSLFRELQARVSQQLLWQTGGLLVGPPEHLVMKGVAQSAREHALDVEALSSAQLRSRYSSFCFEAGSEGLLEKNAGYVNADAVNAAHLALAPKATIHWDTEVQHVDREGERVVLRTQRGDFSASRLVMATGAWLQETLGLTLQRQWQVVLPMRAPLPLFNVVSEAWPHSFYGLPTGANQLAIGQHHGGRTCTIEDAFTSASAEELGPLNRFVSEALGRSAAAMNARVGLYAVSANKRGHVDFDPSDERVVLVGGFSGHGFKFAPAVGRAVAELLHNAQRASPFSIWRSLV